MSDAPVGITQESKRLKSWDSGCIIFNYVIREWSKGKQICAEAASDTD